MSGGLDPLEVWSPLPPLESGVADYVHEQLDRLDSDFDLTLIAEDAGGIDASIRRRFRVLSKEDADPARPRLYHVGNSPLHAYVYREALRVPGVVVLHEWNLHELILGFAVRANDFASYRAHLRREHGARGSVAAHTIASALGGRHWTGVFPLNAEILDRALAAVCLSSATAARVSSRVPGLPVLHLPHHAVLRSNAHDRAEARRRLGLAPDARVVLAPGLGTASKSLGVVRDAMDGLRSRMRKAQLVTVGGGEERGGESAAAEAERRLGRVDLETLGDALLAADLVVALRFPSRGETSGVVMRALAAGRACVVSAGSTADEDLPQGVVARVGPGPGESRELLAMLEFLLSDQAATERLERLSAACAATRRPEPLTGSLSIFLREIAGRTEALKAMIQARQDISRTTPPRLSGDVQAAAASLGLFHLPRSVYRRLDGLLDHR